MMKKLSKSAIFTVPLGASAHCLAEKFHKQHKNPKKAKQIYLNTLAVSAVNFYLRCIEIETDLEGSQSWNPVMQSLLDVADLEVKNRGKLECRPVYPDNDIVYIPPEVWSDRIGYVAVQFDRSLQQATLLGFTKMVNTEQLPISELRSLDELLAYLSSVPSTKAIPVQVNLSQWFDNIFEAGWHSLETLLRRPQGNLAFSFRSASGLSETSVKRAKLINLGLQLGGQSVALVIALAKSAGDDVTMSDPKVNILVQMHPVNGETHLPANLEVSLLSDSGEAIQEVRSRTQDNYIQLKRFRGVPGESFNIQVAFANVKITETFVI